MQAFPLSSKSCRKQSTSITDTENGLSAFHSTHSKPNTDCWKESRWRRRSHSEECHWPLGAGLQNSDEMAGKARSYTTLCPRYSIHVMGSKLLFSQLILKPSTVRCFTTTAKINWHISVIVVKSTRSAGASPAGGEDVFVIVVTPSSANGLAPEH